MGIPVWARGFRQPFSFTVRPGTAPYGTLDVADVGWATWKKLNVVKVLELPLPGSNIKDLKEISYHDLTAHPSGPCASISKATTITASPRPN